MRSLLLLVLALGGLLLGASLLQDEGPGKTIPPAAAAQDLQSAPAPSRVDPGQAPAQAVPGARAQPGAGQAAARGGLRLLVRSRTPRRLRTPGEPMGEVSFELRRVGDGAQGRTRFPGRTDQPGEIWVELGPEAGVELDASGVPQLTGRVVEPGLVQWTARAEAPSEGVGGAVLNLACEPGGTARGKVVDAAGGTDLGSTEVRLRPWIQGQDGRKLGFGPSAKLSALGAGPRLAMFQALGYGGGADAGASTGAFELHFTKPISGSLIAQSPAYGVGALPDVDLDPLDPPQDLVVTLRGPGRIAGTVTDREGKPAAALSLLVLLAELDDTAGSFVLPEPAASERLVEGQGQLWATPVTDAQGRFEVPGLRPDGYVVRAKVDSRGGYPILLTPRPVLADGAPLELAFTRPHVVVQLRQPDGRPLEVEGRARGGAFGPSLFFGGVAPRKWPDKPRVVLLEEGLTGAGGAPGARSKGGSAAGPGAYSFEVTEGRKYWVAAQGPGFRCQLVEHLMPVGGGRQEITLTAEEDVPLGSVEVRVAVDGSAEAHGSSVSVTLEDLSTGAALLADSRAKPGSEVVFQAPIGRYRIVAAGESSIGMQHGVLWAERSVGRAEAVVEISAEPSQPVELVLGRGARLKVTLAGSQQPEDLEAVQASRPHLALEGNEEHAAREAGSARLSLCLPGRRPEPVFRTEEWSGSSAAGTHRTASWPLGASETSMMVSAGSYTLVARMPGGRTVQKEVVLSPGATLAVRLALPD